MKSILYFLIFLFIFPFCTKDFEIVEATKQRWTGGNADAGSGTDYVVKMVAKQNHEKLTIDQLWIGDDFYKVFAFVQDQNTRNTLFVKKDTIFIKAHYLQQPNRKGVMMEVKEYENLDKPYDFKGEALIGYTLKGKRKYKEIEKLKTLKYIPYP